MDLQKPQPIVKVEVYAPDGTVESFDKNKDADVMEINAGTKDGVGRVLIQFKNGTRKIFIAMPYILETELPEELNKTN